jgi:hypothetical protein
VQKHLLGDAFAEKRSDPPIQPLDGSLLCYLEVKFHGLNLAFCIFASKRSISKHPFLLWMENRGKAGIPVQQPQPLPGKGFIEAWVELLFFWLSKRYHNAKKKSSTFSKFLRKYFNKPEMCRNLPCSR